MRLPDKLVGPVCIAMVIAGFMLIPIVCKAFAFWSHWVWSWPIWGPYAQPFGQ